MYTSQKNSIPRVSLTKMKQLILHQHNLEQPSDKTDVTGPQIEAVNKSKIVNQSKQANTEGKSTSRKPSICAITLDVISGNIFVFFDVYDLVNAGTVSRSWYIASKAPTLWDSLYIQDFAAIGEMNACNPESQLEATDNATDRPCTPYFLFSPTGRSLLNRTKTNSNPFDLQLNYPSLSPILKYQQAIGDRQKRINERKMILKERQQFERQIYWYNVFVHFLSTYTLTTLYAVAAVAGICFTVLLHYNIASPIDQQYSLWIVFAPVFMIMILYGISLVLGTIIYLLRDKPTSLAYGIWSHYQGIIKKKPFHTLKSDKIVICQSWLFFFCILSELVLMIDHLDTPIKSRTFSWQTCFTPVIVLFVCVNIPLIIYAILKPTERMATLSNFVANISLMCPILLLAWFIIIKYDKMYDLSMYAMLTPIWVFGTIGLLLPLLTCINFMVRRTSVLDGVILCTFAWGIILPIMGFLFLLCIHLESEFFIVTPSTLFAPLYLWFVSCFVFACFGTTQQARQYPSFESLHQQRLAQLSIVRKLSHSEQRPFHLNNTANAAVVPDIQRNNPVAMPRVEEPENEFDSALDTTALSMV